MPTNESLELAKLAKRASVKVGKGFKLKLVITKKQFRWICIRNLIRKISGQGEKQRVPIVIWVPKIVYFVKYRTFAF